jgi:hypothetical protein
LLDAQRAAIEHEREDLRARSKPSSRQLKQK